MNELEELGCNDISIDVLRSKAWSIDGDQVRGWGKEMRCKG